MMTISIPKPCHEDWNDMTANEQGRHCNVCCKTVVDFTSMTDEEVKYFFVSKKKEENVCGRFKNEQLQRINITLPYNIYKISMPLWKQFLTACLLAFSSMLFSCDALVGNDKTLGETIPFAMSDNNPVNPQLTVPPLNVMLGTILQIDTTTKSSCPTLMGDTISVETVTQGMTIIETVRDTFPSEILPPPLEQIDTPQTILTGKVMIDTNTIINPKAADSVKKKKALPPDSSNCSNQNFINL
jgi:hypothetical protein